jgi:nicotinate-nucleotide pyrophosphorylase (carboxylating)
MFSESETSACRSLIELALREDLGQVGDLTSQAVMPADLHGQAVFVARASGALAGLPAAALVVQAVDARLRFEPLLQDGAKLAAGDRLARVAGPMRGVLSAERTALNFLQYLSGIASLTRKFVDAVAGLPAHILDTRKTLPGWRVLSKYAVRCGGGHNHRMGLFDGVLIKDNHLKGLPMTDSRGQIEEAVAAARASVGDSVPVEIEVESLEQLDVALACRPNIVLLDNMTTEQMKEAVRRRNQQAPHVQLEASGGVNLQTVRAIAETGVERISVGALTHSAPALDIALDYER